TATFGIGEPGAVPLTSSGDFDVFVARYASTGTLVWAKRAGGSGTGTSGLDVGQSAAAIADGSSFVTGLFHSATAASGLAEATGTTRTGAGASGTSDVFVARYNADGTLAWAKRAGGTATDQGRSLAAIADGSTFVAGFFQSATATFGPGRRTRRRSRAL